MAQLTATDGAAAPHPLARTEMLAPRSRPPTAHTRPTLLPVKRTETVCAPASWTTASKIANLPSITRPAATSCSLSLTKQRRLLTTASTC